MFQLCTTHFLGLALLLLNQSTQLCHQVLGILESEVRGSYVQRLLAALSTNLRWAEEDRRREWITLSEAMPL